MFPRGMIHIISVDPAPDSSQVRKAQELSDSDLVGAILTRPYTLWLLAERQRRDRERYAEFGRDVRRWQQYIRDLPVVALLQLLATSKDPFYREEWDRRSKSGAAGNEAAPAPEFTNLDEAARQAHQAAEELGREVRADPAAHTHSFEVVAGWLELATRAEEAMRSVTLADDDPLKRQLDEALRHATEERKAYETALLEVLMARGPVAVGEDLYAYQPHSNRIKKTPFRWGATVRIPCPRLKIRRDEEAQRAQAAAPAPENWPDAMNRKA